MFSTITLPESHCQDIARLPLSDWFCDLFPLSTAAHLTPISRRQIAHNPVIVLPAVKVCRTPAVGAVVEQRAGQMMSTAERRAEL
jgi:hypothetical protein